MGDGSDAPVRVKSVFLGGETYCLWCREKCEIMRGDFTRRDGTPTDRILKHHHPTLCVKILRQKLGWEREH